MTSFILNNQTISTQARSGTTLLDFIRYGERLTGTKIGCREGDCGACTVLEGRLVGNKMEYQTIVSCLTPLGNAAGKHIVTIEGLNSNRLNPAQKAFVDHGGTQCGFCTPGFIVSLTGHTMEKEPSSLEKAIDSMNGNICRCTGYRSIRDAAKTVSAMLEHKDTDDPIGWLVEQRYLPAYFTGIPGRLSELQPTDSKQTDSPMMVAGGTDLMVQRPEEAAEMDPVLLYDRQELKGITTRDGHCIVGAGTTATDIMESDIMNAYFPNLKKYFKLISSEPIRNMGTLGGNMGNASPIADLVIFFLALNARLKLKNLKNDNEREVDLKSFFLDYKKLDLQLGEIIFEVSFPLPGKNSFFNFEKVSKRNTLDIASVNSAISLELDNDKITRAHLSLGGVAPVPKYLHQTGRFLTGRKPDTETVREAGKLLMQEISPISDIRGSKEYKKLLARQLLYAHFLTLFPEQINEDALLKHPAQKSQKQL